MSCKYFPLSRVCERWTTNLFLCHLLVFLINQIPNTDCRGFSPVISRRKREPTILCNKSSVLIRSHGTSLPAICIVFQIMSGEAEMRISLIKAKATEELTRFQNLQEPVPEALSEKLQQIDALNQSIQVKCSH